MGWFSRHQEEEAEETHRLVQHAAQLHGVPASEVVHAVLDEDDEELDDQEEARGSKKHVGTWVTLIVVGVLFGAGVIYMMRLAGSADNAGPTADSGPKAMQKAIQPTPTGLPTLTGQYIAFSYSGVFDSVKSLVNLPNTAERYAIGSKGDYRRSIIVTVENRTPTLDEDSGYKYRTLNPALYRAQVVKVPGGSAVVMIKSDNTERTLYFLHGERLAIVSVTSSNGTDTLEAYISAITASIRWVG